MKYKAGIGFVQLRTAKALAEKLGEHADVITAKKYLPSCGVCTFINNCDEEGKKIVEKYFKKWISPSINWSKE